MNLGAGKKQLARILMKKREVKTKIVPRLLDHEKMVLENVQPLQRMLQPGSQGTVQMDTDQIRDQYDLLSHSLERYLPIREEVIQLTQDSVRRKGRCDVICLMTCGFGGETDTPIRPTVQKSKGRGRKKPQRGWRK